VSREALTRVLLVGVWAFVVGPFLVIAPSADASGPAGDRLAAPQQASSGPRSVTVRSGSTQVTVSYRFDTQVGDIPYLLRIARSGKSLFEERVRGIRRGDRTGPGFLSSEDVVVRDLDGDHEPEAMLLFNWRGAYCCVWSRIYRYDPARATYVPTEHVWGNSRSAPRLRDLNGDGRPEFVSYDERLSEVFANYASSVVPVRIFSFELGRLRDVTRSYPRLIKQDAARIWRLYLKYPRAATAILPGWAADEYMLARGAAVDRVLAEARRMGEFAHPFSDVGDSTSGLKNAEYIKALKALLRETGYVRG
jgi:hypothetical protein